MKDANHLEAIIFDLGGVLAPISFLRPVKHLAAFTGLAPDVISARLTHDEPFKKFERGEIPLAQYRAHINKCLGAELSSQQFDESWNSIFLDPLPATEPLVTRLAESIRLVVLSNTNRIHAEVWLNKYRSILAHFEKIFVSHEIGARKPEPEAYRKVLDYLGAPPKKVLFVDDTPANVEAARALGMQGLVAKGPNEIAAGLRARGVDMMEG